MNQLGFETDFITLPRKLAFGFGWTPWNIYLFLAGVLGWLAVGVLWRDRAIMAVHAVALSAMTLGLASQ